MAKRLYIQLHNADEGNSVTLPINPENIDIPSGKDIKVYTILDYGNVPVIGYNNLREITLESLLPDTTSYFALLSSLVEALKHKPYTKEKSVSMLHKWAQSKKPIRVIIAGDAYENINMEFHIKNFVESIREGNRDVKSRLELIEYKNPTAETKTYNTDLKTAGSELTKLIPRPIRKFIPEKMTAQQGATLYKIAKLVYGEASARSNKLANLNAIFDRNKDIAGTIIDMLPLDEAQTVKEAL